MANSAIENIDLGNVEREGGKFRDELLIFAGADTFAPGTLLARKAVTVPATATADGGNTGDGTITAVAAADGPEVPLVGTYTFTCITAATNGGTFRLTDPNGKQVDASLIMTAGAGASTVFEVGGLVFTITDGATDFAAGDFFTLAITADGKLLPYDPAGVGGEQLPLGVLTYEVSRTGAGNEPIRALVAGEVNKDRLIIDVDGDGSNITDAILDELRSAGIVAIDVEQLAELDNQ